MKKQLPPGQLLASTAQHIVSHCTSLLARRHGGFWLLCYYTTSCMILLHTDLQLGNKRNVAPRQQQQDHLTACAGCRTPPTPSNCHVRLGLLHTRIPPSSMQIQHQRSSTPYPTCAACTYCRPPSCSGTYAWQAARRCMLRTVAACCAATSGPSKPSSATFSTLGPPQEKQRKLCAKSLC